MAAIAEKLYGAFDEFDAMLCEINPLIVTPDGEVKALDSKFTVDDNALYRHPDVAEMRDVEAADPHERLAREKGIDEPFVSKPSTTVSQSKQESK